MRISISGYYGFGNIGDEAILLSLKEGFPENEIFVLDKENRFNFDYIKRSKVFVSGGGGLLQDKTSSKSFLYYVGLIFIAKALKKKILILSQSIGPIKNPFNLFLLKKALKMADIVTVRDKKSFEFLESLGIKDLNILETADPTFILSPSSRIPKLLNKEGLFYVGVAPRVFKGMPEGFEESFAVFCDNIIDKAGVRIVFIPFHKQQDIDICRRIMGKMRNHSKLLEKELPPKEMISFISEFDFIIGTRLHSLIFAVKGLVPSIGISYDPKVSSFMEEVSMPVFDPYEGVNPESMANAFLSMKENISGIKESLEIEKRKLYAKAMLNFGLLNILNKE